MSVALIARTVRGTEWIAADEISELGVSDISLRAREVRFRVPSLDSSLLGLRTVDDIFLFVGGVDGVGHTKDVVPWLVSRFLRFDWAGALRDLSSVRLVPRGGRFDVVTSLVGRRNYSRYVVEDAVGEALARPLGLRFVSRTPGAGQPTPVDLTVRVFVEGATATVALRLGAEPLHRRAYKQHTERGTLHPPLAAALARLGGVGDGDVVVDPACGDGTIPIEVAALRPGARLLASEYDAGRLRNAVANAGLAGASIAFVRSDAGRQPWRSGTVDFVVTNPPWNVSVDAAGLLADSFGPFWSELSRILGPAGQACLVADVEMDTPGVLRGLGYRIALASQVRLAGRLSHIVLCAPPDRPQPELPAGVAGWRERALKSGVVTADGF